MVKVLGPGSPAASVVTRPVVGVMTIAATGAVMVLVSNVTAPTRASNLPSTVASVTTVIDAWARMVPLKIERVAIVAEEPTCQKTLEALAPLMRLTTLSVAVTSVDAALKMKTASSSPSASSVRIPVISSVPDAVE
jgi:hypothetical protein